MAVTAQRVTVSTTAVALNTDTDVVGGSTLVIQNQDGTNTASLGPSSVTAGNGYRLAVSSTLVLDVPPGEQIYAIRDGAADVVVSVLRLGS